MSSNEKFWQTKLAAYLHDPPCKMLDIQHHTNVAATFAREAGLTDPAFTEDAFLKLIESVTDHMTSAADRFPFPSPNQLTVKWEDKQKADVNHPFGGNPLTIENISKEPETILKKSIHQDKASDHKTGFEKKFHLIWRLWRQRTVQDEKASSFMHFPADSRMPDHSIWNHMAMTSALSACMEGNDLKPSFLLFQVGPVQSMIAQARSTRDLWSGSYLLSWLTAHAIKAVTDELGPDNILFPYLCGQPIFDVLSPDIGKMETWGYKENPEKAFEYDAKQILTPSIPNRFLALVPESRGKEIAEKAEKALLGEFQKIADKCWDWLENTAFDLGEKPENWKKRWDAQVKRAFNCTWQVMPWDGCSIEEGIKKFKDLPVGKEKNGSADNLQKILNLVTKDVPIEHRDSRYYENKEKKSKLNNAGFLWSYQYALCDFYHAARRNTREFMSWDACYDNTDKGTPKDSLSGVEEIIGTEEFWKTLNDKYSNIFKSDRLGALNLIKKLWCRTDGADYICEKTGLREGKFREALSIKSTEDIADAESLAKNGKKNKYIAVLAMDGDEMGKWLSGAKNPELSHCFAPETLEYFKKNNMDISGIKRPLNPSFHLQFSEALQNFTRIFVRKIVEAYEGELIYAGGDDVLAMLPAPYAMECGYVLRSFFQGKKPEENKIKFGDCAKKWMEDVEFPSEGWIKYKNVTFLLPGPKADVSCGIAMGHHKYPLQKLIQRAHKAEKEAKSKKYDRAAFCVHVLKHGGEITEWGSKWDTPAIAICSLYHRLVKEEKISTRFPYMLRKLAGPYLPKDTHSINPLEDVDKTLWKTILEGSDLERVFKRQFFEHAKDDKDKESFSSMIKEYLNKEDTKADQFLDLFSVAAFTARISGGREEEMYDHE